MKQHHVSLAITVIGLAVGQTTDNLPYEIPIGWNCLSRISR